MKEVYTLDDLVSRTRLDEGAELPARLAVLGAPVAHSLSPQLHQPALGLVYPGKTSRIGNAFQRAVQTIGPGMIRADEAAL